MGEIYEKMDNMLGEIKDIMMVGKHADKFFKIEEIVLKRWEKMNVPMHCLGFALTPRFYDQRYLAMAAPGGTTRKSPNQDKEVITGVMEAFKKIAENSAEEKLLRNQFATFHSRKGLYGMAAAQVDAIGMDAIDWWATYGSETPELAEVARKVLSQPITTSSAERNWSTYSFIHNVKRNRLNSLRADKLVFIHSNIRLLSRFTEGYKDGPFKKWDVDPELTYIDDSTMRLEDLRWNSLEHEFDEAPEKDDQEVMGSQVSASQSTSRQVLPSSSTPRIRRTRVQAHITAFAKSKGKEVQQ